MRTHNRTHFYKYATAATAENILSSCSMRWSSPVLFNDIFDHQMEFDFEFTEEEFINAMVNKVEEIVYSNPAIKLDTSQPIGKVLTDLQKIHKKMEKSYVMGVMQEGVIEVTKNLMDFKKGINSLLAEYLESTRVLCVTEDNDNLCMWSHYADNHRGVVIKLRCIDEFDNALLVARKVAYSENVPIMASLSDLVNHFTCLNRIDLTGNLRISLAYTKSNHWSYENEWRVSNPDPTLSSGDKLYDDFGEYPLVFGAIYLGCKISVHDRDKILSLLKNNLNHVEAYQAKKKKAKFGLSFERLS